MTGTTDTFTNWIVRMGILLFGLMNVFDGHAQCGSVGDPIVNITFGTVSNPSLEGGNTTYIPNPNGQLTDGEYKLASNINQGRGNWHNLRDHTDERDEGMMLIVNASHEAGEFYRIRVSGLCEDTRFRFSAWIASANRAAECDGNPIPPNVRFVIEDVNGNIVNDPYVTGNINATASPEWREYGFEFDTGNETEFDLVLINDNPGGCGNDLAIDDIQFRPCGPEIALDLELALMQADTLFFCEGDVTPIPIKGEIIGDGSYATGAAFQWQTWREGHSDWEDIEGEDGKDINIVPTHNQWYRLTAAASTDNLREPRCRISSDSIRFAQLIPQVDVADVEDRGPICENGSILLNPPEYTGTGAGSLTYQWLLHGGNGPEEIPGATSASFEFRALRAGTFRLQRQAINGCGARFVTHTVEIDVMATLRTTFTLPQQAICADDRPLLLSGGAIVNGDVGMQGVFSGNGVSNGYFYPDIAGVGQHTLSFSPPAGTLCGESSQATITVYDTIHLERMVDIVMLPGQSVTLRPQSNASRFSWSNQPGLDDYSDQYPTASPHQTTTYTLTASNAAGCEKSGHVTVTVLQNLTAPNSFTPNGDGVNDTWQIEGLDDYPNALLQVFNRWGSLVFSAKGYSKPWDGRFNGAPLPFGTYYYTLSSDILVQPISGSVSILR